MQVINKIDLKFEGLDKCHLSSDHDCSIGQIYDYSCVLQSFCIERMKAAQEEAKPKTIESEA